MKKFFGSEERALFGCSVGMKKDRSKQREGSSRGNNYLRVSIHQGLRVESAFCAARGNERLQHRGERFGSKDDCHRSR